MSDFFWRVAESTASALFIAVVFGAFKTYLDVRRMKRDLDAAWRKIRSLENDRNSTKDTKQDSRRSSHGETD